MVKYINDRMRYSYEKRLEKREALDSLLLDSSLIFAYNNNKRLYDFKVIQCGNYYQVYNYSNLKVKKDKLEKDKKNEDKLYNICKDLIDNKEKEKSRVDNQLKEIDIKNIQRSKINLQRLAKANEKEFKTFITLTFKDNINNINDANKIFHDFISNIKRLKKDFKYLGVPEFQKRGAVHYHLMTNLSITKDNNIILKQPNKKYMYDLKYWTKGYSSVYSIRKNHINVVAYLTKYFTKDIDNRLFGKRRYLYSRNLIKPCEVYLSSRDIEEFIKVLKIYDYNLAYTSNYNDTFNNDIEFREYVKLETSDNIYT